MVRFIFCIYFLLLNFSCGKQSFPDYGSQELVLRDEEEEAHRTYFKTLNPSHTGKVKGHVVLWIRDLQFYARIVIFRGPKKTRIQQYIHSGIHCPTQRDDSNKDGKIDFFEAIISSGGILVPLDGKLRTQSSGLNWFPESDRNGAYYYSRAANLKWFMEDLRAKDEDPNDHLLKLNLNEELALNRRVVIIYGSTTDPLLPLACAEIYGGESIRD